MGKVGELWVEIGAKLDKFNRGLTDAQRAMQRVGQKFSAAGRQMTMKVTLPLVALGAVAVKVAADFEQSLTNAFAVTGSSSLEVKKQMEELARSMGENTVFSASQAADAMYYMASAGYKAKDMTLALKPILDLAAATQSDLAFATDTVVASLNQFGLGAKGAERVSNVFAAAISNSQATMEKLSASMRYVGPIFNSMGKSVEEATSVLMGLYNAGYDASMAGTALRMSIAKLLKPTSETKNAIERLGLSMKDVNPETNKFADIIQLLGERGATTKDIMEIFGVRAGPAMAALISKGGEALKDYEQKITGTKAASEMAEKQIDTLKGSFKLLISALTEAAIQISKVLAPIIKDLVDKMLIPMVKAFSALPKPVKVAMVGFAGFAAAIGPLLMILGKLLTILPLIKIALASLMGPIGAIIAGVAAAGAAINHFINKYKDSQDKQIEATRKSSNVMGECMKLRKQLIDNEILTIEEWSEIFNKHGRNHGRVLNAIANNPAYESIREKLEAIKKEEEKVGEETENVSEIFQKKLAPSIKLAETEISKLIPASRSLAGVLDKVQDNLIHAGSSTDEVKAKIRELAAQMGVSSADMQIALYNVQAQFMNLAGFTLPQLQLSAEQAAEKTKSKWTEVSERIRDRWTTTLSDILQGTTSLKDGLGAIWGTIKQQFFDMVAQMITKFSFGLIKEMISGVKGAASSIGSTMGNIGKAISGVGTGLATLITSLATAIATAATTLAAAAPAIAIVAALGLAIFAGFKLIGSLFKKKGTGAQEYATKLLETIRDILGRMESMLGAIPIKMDVIMSSFWAPLMQKMDVLNSTMFEIRDMAKDFFKSFKENIKVIAEVMTGASQGMISILGEIRNAIDSMHNTLSSKGTIYVDVLRAAPIQESIKQLGEKATTSMRSTDPAGAVKQVSAEWLMRNIKYFSERERAMPEMAIEGMPKPEIMAPDLESRQKTQSRKAENYNLTFNLNAIDAKGMDELVEEKVFPKIRKLIQTNKGEAKTDFREDLEY